MTHGSAAVPDWLQRRDVGACELPLPASRARRFRREADPALRADHAAAACRGMNCSLKAPVLVRARSRVKNEIHAVLVRCLKDRPPAADLFGVKGRAWLGDQQ